MTAARKPLIGIVAHPNQEGPEEINSRYLGRKDDVGAILRAGGVPVMLVPVYDEDSWAEAFARVDGIMLTGGWDMGPEAMGLAGHPKIENPNVLRDQADLTAARMALALNKPLLAICRGAQVLNVAAGGTLVVDIPSEVPGALKHRRVPEEGDVFQNHVVTLAEGSLIADIMGSLEILSNSFHHQAVKEPGQGLRVSAWTTDGVIEAIEHPQMRFCLGLQWHPEEHSVPQTNMQPIFERFLQAASGA